MGIVQYYVDAQGLARSATTGKKLKRKKADVTGDSLRGNPRYCRVKKAESTKCSEKYETPARIEAREKAKIRRMKIKQENQAAMKVPGSHIAPVPTLSAVPGAMIAPLPEFAVAAGAIPMTRAKMMRLMRQYR